FSNITPKTRCLLGSDLGDDPEAASYPAKPCRPSQSLEPVPEKEIGRIVHPASCNTKSRPGASTAEMAFPSIQLPNPGEQRNPLANDLRHGPSWLRSNW